MSLGNDGKEAKRHQNLAIALADDTNLTALKDILNETDAADIEEQLDDHELIVKAAGCLV